MAVTASFDFDSKEYYRALREASQFNPARWLIPLMGIVLPVTMLWLTLGRQWGQMTTSRAFWNALPWLLLGAFYLSLMPLMAKTAARKALENDPSLRGLQTRTIDDAGIQVQGAGFTQTLSWNDLVRAVETSHFFLFFYNKRMAHYLPKRSMDSDGIARVRELIQDASPSVRRSRAAGRSA